MHHDDTRNDQITTALLLAVGSGFRLRPVTNDQPKCLTEIDGIPILERLVDCLCVNRASSGWLSSWVILAARLHIKSKFGAILDNVCDTFSHTVFVMLVAMQYGNMTSDASLPTAAIALAGLLAAVALVLRVVSRLVPASAPGAGLPTNELIRHLLFVLLLANNYEFNPALLLTLTFALHEQFSGIKYEHIFLLGPSFMAGSRSFLKRPD